MFKDFAIALLVKALKDMDEIITSRIKVYVFGSIFWKTQNISDVDILVIYKSSVDLIGIKRELHLIDTMLPLDVIYMTVQEEKEFNFLAEQQAVNLFDDGLKIS